MELKQILEKNYTLVGVYHEIEKMREELEDKAYHGRVREETVIESGEALESLAKLEKRVEGLPRLRLTLAFKPEEKQIAKMGSWVREKVNKRALLDLRVDKNLIAGARVVWQSRAADFSLKSKLTAKHGEIKELLPS